MPGSPNFQIWRAPIPAQAERSLTSLANASTEFMRSAASEVERVLAVVTSGIGGAMKGSWIMRDGEIVQIGTPDEVVGAPADDYVRDFTSDVPRSHVLTLKWVMRDADGRRGAARTTPGAPVRPDRA